MFSKLSRLWMGCLTVFACVSAYGEGQFQFRGESGNGVLPASIPESWSDVENLSWSIDVPGSGWSAPIVAGDLVFLTTAVSEKDQRPKGFGEGVQSMGSFYRSKAPDQPFEFEVRCLQKSDGKLLWKKSVVSRTPPFKIHPSNSYATESPVTDGKFVYSYFATVGMVACHDFDGNEIWKRELGSFKTGNNFGTGSSLAIDGGRVFVQCDNEEKSFVCALDNRTGEEAWRRERKQGTSWASPVIWKHQARTELVTCGNGIVTSYEPETGEVFWTLSGFGGAFSATPTFDDQRIYFGQSGRTSRGPLVAVNAGATGELTFDNVGDKGVAWLEETAAPGMCSPVVHDGFVYVLSRGVLSCHDAKTGERIYRERLKNASSVTASLWAAGDKIFALNEGGDTIVSKAGADFEALGQNTIAGLYWSTPTATESELFIRSADKLHCIRGSLRKDESENLK